MYTALCSNSTVDRENFAVKIISRSWPTAKIKHAKKTYTAMINGQVRASPHPLR